MGGECVFFCYLPLVLGWGVALPSYEEAIALPAISTMAWARMRESISIR
ncbi:hypothetical protein MICAH_5370001 [Microcystis aeruginosa PCC 9809]|uniref:Uncharacterized protein n=1 Tax=Microcystis aeruginosa PCC 9809 TaxID=1160285 RepID=I4I3N6_MICAE|nr:hypothetical protein MICAH_5370001 [Microcystis aeruginosa PCC 9809]